MIGIVTSVRRSLLAGGLLRARSLPLPVASVGNLSAGGTGKTPHVAHLARLLLARGLRPCILTRGYGREGCGVVAVSDGESLLADARTGGDEPVLLSRLLPGVPVFVGESRWEAGREFLRRGGVADLFLLDDGFQHLSLRRDVDVVLVDCLRGIGNGRTLPFGPLREGASALRRSHAVVVTKCPSLAAGEAAARRLPIPAGLPVAFTTLAPTGLAAADGRRTSLPGAGWEVFAFSALARNDQFRDTLVRLGWRVSSFRGFRDHHRFTAGEVAALRREAGTLPAVTTGKDLVRLSGEAWDGLFALDVEVDPLGGMEAVERVVLDRIGVGGGEGG